MTRKFYTKDQFKAYAKQQIQENEDLIIAWRIVGELIENFDNKVINKRLKDYINDALKSEFKHAWFNYVDIGEDKRINAGRIVDKVIDEAIMCLVAENMTLKNEIKNIDKIEQEFNEIKSMIHDFENDKSRYIKQLYSFN